MSAIYLKLGADASKIPILWLAGPMTGLLIQPIIGSMSDRKWNRLGRRRSYFLTGALLASTALFFMPDSPALWVAATMLWIVDANYYGISGNSPNGIPLSVLWAFKLGAAAFLLEVVWTVVTSKEYPPEDMGNFYWRKSSIANSNSSRCFPESARRRGFARGCAWRFS